MPELTATCCLLANVSMYFPVQANPGDYIAVMPPRFQENLWVMEPTDLWVVRRRAFPEGKLWSVLADLLERGDVTLVHAPGRHLLVHLVATGQLSAGQAVRVLRAG